MYLFFIKTAENKPKSMEAVGYFWTLRITLKSIKQFIINVININ